MAKPKTAATKTVAKGGVKTGANSRAKSGKVDQSQLATELKVFLKQKLPDYMVPLFFVFLEKIPLTPNGKMDRQALPAPERSQSEIATPRRLPRDELEIQLVKIWQRVLELEAIAIDDNFFDLGGHSLLAVRLMAEIERVFGKKIPLISLFQGATVNSLAKLLRQDLDKYSWPTLVEIQPGSSKPPLFCVSTPNVNALGYLSLARHLGPDQPVYGLQAQYPEDLEGEHSKAAVEELATDYLESVRKAQPGGPYQLIGMCRGAHIAYEMARRLEQEKAPVALVGVLDTWVMENTYNRLLYVEYYLRRLKSLMHLSPWEAFAEIRRRTERLFQRPTAKSSKVSATAVTSKNPLQVYFPGPDFVPATYGGRVSVFRSKKQPLNRVREKELGWGRLAAGGVDLHYVSGNHGNVLREPYVKELARELKQCLLGNAATEVKDQNGRRSKNSQAA